MNSLAFAAFPVVSLLSLGNSSQPTFQMTSPFPVSVE